MKTPDILFNPDKSLITFVVDAVLLALFALGAGWAIIKIAEFLW